MISDNFYIFAVTLMCFEQNGNLEDRNEYCYENAHYKSGLTRKFLACVSISQKNTFHGATNHKLLEIPKKKLRKISPDKDGNKNYILWVIV